MAVDGESLKYVLAAIAIIAFNVPVLLTYWRLRSVPLEEFVQEKDAAGRKTGGISYSRVTGLIGAVVVASLFWMMSNISIAVAILNPGDLANILTGTTKLFFVGAALFVPYAFNQIKTLLQ